MTQAQGSITGLHYKTGKPIRIHLADGVIQQIEHLDNTVSNDHSELQTEKWPWIGPGLVDLQINGYAGIDFNHPSITQEDVITVTRMLRSEGTTTYYPTVITNSDSHITSILHTIASACASDVLTSRSIAGIHLEGPFISPHDGPRGAHDRTFVKAPDWHLFQQWQQAANGLIQIITLSPEWDNAPAFIEQCVGSGVIVSIGHTAATPDQINRAVQAGATLSTHLGNGAHLTLPRHPNYIWEQLAEDRLATCMIADGFHLPDSLMKVMLRTKGKRLFLVSDAVYLSGLEPGHYDTHIGGQVVLTEEGRLHLASEPALLAGSAQLLRAGIQHLANADLCTAADAWDMASILPATYMNLEAGRGIAEGAPADLVTFYFGTDGKLVLNTVFKDGHQANESSEESLFSQS
ncbi:N-acetylglucosamine-6-phosphate deacetylase [Paenibacillus sp. strain BS8-2]